MNDKLALGESVFEERVIDGGRNHHLLIRTPVKRTPNQFPHCRPGAIRSNQVLPRNPFFSLQSLANSRHRLPMILNANQFVVLLRLSVSPNGRG